jgi:uncharacterized protein YdeI (YjbR/CyaY-like superfamily)
MKPAFEYPEDSFDPQSISDWARWLKANHAKSDGVWLILRKKSTGAGLAYADILETAICYGWIDAKRKSATDTTYIQRFTPRGKQSIWSKINRDKATTLIASGRMQAAGLSEVERARKDGRWDRAYDRQGAAPIPDDLAAELEKRPKARAFFEQLSSQNRYAILFRLQTAKKPETRVKRLATFVEMLEQERQIHP